MRPKTTAIIITVLTFFSTLAWGQYYEDEPVDLNKHERDAKRLISLNLTDSELYFTAVGVVLLLLAFWTAKKGWGISGWLLFLGCIALLPILILIFKLALIAIHYSIYLAMIIGGIYLVILMINKSKQKRE